MIMHDMVLPREFSGGRLRRLRPADLDSFQAYRAIPELGRYQGWSPRSAADALQFLSEMNQARLFTPGEWVQLGIADPETDSLVGDIGLYLSEDASTGEVGFTLQPSTQGRGIAGHAVKEALQLLFTVTTVTRVLGVTDARNIPSIRLLERLGFECVETRRVIYRAEGCSEKVYSLSK